MTRKDYINIAAAIQACQVRIENERHTKLGRSRLQSTATQLKERYDEQLRGVRRAAAHLADFLADDNPRFDPVRFLKACGYSSGPILREDLEREMGEEVPVRGPVPSLYMS